MALDKQASLAEGSSRKRIAAAVVVAIGLSSVAAFQAFSGGNFMPAAMVPGPFVSRNISIAPFVITDVSDPREAGKLRDPAVAVAAARKILREDPLDMDAIQLLAMASSQRGSANAGQLSTLLADVGKRNPKGQIWLAQQALLNRDFNTAITHIDRALRVRPGLAAQIFPPLTQVLSDAEFRRQMADYLQRGVSWRADFLAYAAAQPQEAASTAQLFLDMPPLEPSASATLMAERLTKALADQGKASLLKEVYPRLPGGDAKAVSDDGAGLKTFSGYPPLNWEVALETNRGAAVSLAQSSSRLHITGFANAGHGGTVARKVVYLAPGPWSLRWVAQSLDLPEGSDASWQIRCLEGDKGEALARRIAVSEEGSDFATFVVPRSCPAIELTLQIRGGQSSTAQVELDDLQLRHSAEKPDERNTSKAS